MEDDRTRQLRERRIAKARERELEQKRAKHGDAILRTLNQLLGENFTANTLRTQESSPAPVSLATRIEESDGLVAAYISHAKARQLLTCCGAVLGGEIAAELWFDEKWYMGLFSCHQLRLPVLVDLAKALEDRVYVSLVDVPGVVVVDHYGQAWSKKDRDFSVVVQGANLEPRVGTCFLPEARSLIRHPSAL